MVEKRGGDATLGTDSAINPEDQCVIDMLSLMFGAKSTERIVGLLRDFEKEQVLQDAEGLK